MADINIEKKKSNKPIWPWILGLLLLAGIIWAIASIDTDPETQEVAVVEDTYTEEPVNREPQSNVYAGEGGTEAENFVAYVNDKDVQEKMGMDHQVTSEALTRLAASLSSLSQNDNQYQQQINEIRQTADQLRSDPESMKHANHASQAFSTAANVMEQIQQNRFPDAESEVKDVKEAADKVSHDEQLLNQKEEVDSFFEKAANAVEQMKDEMSS